MKRERLWFALAVAAFAAFLVWMAAWSPPALDDWIPIAWHRLHALDARAVVTYTIDNYVSHNPRIGDTFLLLVNGPPALHLILTPLFELALAPLLFAVALARWPRPTWADLRTLAVVQALVWLMLSRPGVIYFYRPHTTNYLFPAVLALLLFAPYRIELARDAPGPARHWLAPLWLALGVLVGLGNEHTGPAMMLGGAALVVVAIKRRRLRPWMMAGVVGLWIGFPLLLTAPGQLVRYGGLVTRQGPLDLIVERGVDGNYDLILTWLADTGLGLVAIALAVLTYLARGAPAGRPPRGAVLTAVTFVGLAVLMAFTVGGSPSITDRLYMASTLLVIAAALIVLDHVSAEPATRRLLAVIAIGVLAFHVVRFVQIYAVVHREAAVRRAQLAAAAPGSTVGVAPYTYWRHSRWVFGDDFRIAPMRAYVATEIYGLAAIDVVPHPPWLEPQVPERFELELAYDPPLPAAEIERERALPISFWRWTINFTPRALDRFRHVPGHTLVGARAYWPDARQQFPMVGKRPVDVMRWHPDPRRSRGDYDVLDGREVELAGARYLAIDRIPPGWTEAYAGGCGQVVPVTPITIRGIVHIPVDVSCQGMVNAVVCWRERCWFGGRFWNARPPPAKGGSRVQKS